MTKVNKFTGFISLFTAVIIIISTIFALGLQTVNATCTSNANAFKVLSKTSYGKVYTLKSSGITIPYTDKNLKDRGTVTNGKSQKAYIENSSDLLYILNVGTYNNVDYAKVSYPSGSKRVEAYIPLSAITTAGNNSKHLYYAKALGEFLCAPRKGGALSSSYYISKGDEVYVLAADSASGNNVQIMYQTGNTWRIAYCSYTDAVRYLDGVTTSSGSTSSASTYSVSNNVLTLLGVKMNEYKVGSTFESGRYATVNGKQVDTAGWQCMGYACYIEYKLYGICHHFSDKFSIVSGSVKVTPTSDAALKALITKAGVGAHIRTWGNKDGGQHSMIIIEITEKGFTVADANASGNNKVEVRTYTWSSYRSDPDKIGKGFYWIKVYNK